MAIILILLIIIILVIFIINKKSQKDDSMDAEITFDISATGPDGKEEDLSFDINLNDIDDLDENMLFEWKTVKGHEICSECQSRHGLRKTYEEWEKIGLPGDNRLMCEPHEETDWGCYCILDPIENDKK